MSPTGLDVKSNIVLYAAIKGLTESEFIEAGISRATVKAIFKEGLSQDPDLKTVNKFARVLNVETYELYMISPKKEQPSGRKEEFIQMVRMVYDSLSEEKQDILFSFLKILAGINH